MDTMDYLKIIDRLTNGGTNNANAGIFAGEAGIEEVDLALVVLRDLEKQGYVQVFIDWNFKLLSEGKAVLAGLKPLSGIRQSVNQIHFNGPVNNAQIMVDSPGAKQIISIGYNPEQLSSLLNGLLENIGLYELSAQSRGDIEAEVRSAIEDIEQQKKESILLKIKNIGDQLIQHSGNLASVGSFLMAIWPYLPIK